MAVKHEDPRALIRYALAGLALTAALSWTLFLVRDALLLIYVSALVAIGLSPLVEAIEHRRSPSRRVPRWAAILAIYLVLIAILVGVGMLVIPPLISQARDFWAMLPNLLHQGQQWLIDRGLLSRELTFREAVQRSSVDGSDAVGTVLGALTGFVGGIFGLMTLLILTFYMLVNGENIVRTFVRMFPSGERPRVEDACVRVTTKVSAWLGGQLVLGGVIAVTAAIGLWALGVPYFYVLALIAGIGELIPVVGPLLSAIPALAVAFTVSPAVALGVLLFFVAQQQFENHVLVPKVMERQVGVSAVVVIIALLLGGSLLGIVGAILAVPTAAIFQVLFEEIFPEAAAPDPESSTDSLISAWRAAAAYLGVTLIATWPLLRGLGRDVAWDLGDPLLVMWAIAWDCEQLLGILRGDVTRLTSFFDANIFHPEPLTLAYSEHFLAQAIQVLPIYAATKNPILCYNLLFLSTFVLSGLGTYLLVRQLTGNTTAAFVAGLLFAFAPYRLPQSPHLQVLSSQWMPLALYGFVRYFDTGRRRPLAGAAAALVAQNLSCGYYMLYFGPFAIAFVVWELAWRGLLRSRAHWRELTIAAAAVAALTAPFLLPYAALHRQLDLGRARSEVVRYSADVYSYGTAFSEQPVWGSIANAYHKAEGDLFPGLVTLVLALIGLVWGANSRATMADATTSSAEGRPNRPYARVLVPLCLALAAAHAVAAVCTLLYRRITVHLWIADLRMSDVNQLVLRTLILVAVALWLSPTLRTRARAFLRSRGFFALALLVAFWLSLGPAPQALGRPVDLFGLYGVLLDHVPGFDGVRVPARYAMVGTLMLAVLGGFGADVISRLRGARVLIAAACVVLLAESLMLPFTVNGTAPPEGFNAPEPRVRRPSRAPAVYASVAALPADTVLAELPLGHPDFDVRAVFYSTAHWHRLLNGYSGFFPRHYGTLTVALSDVPTHPDIARDALRALGTTHVLVHEAAYLGDQGARTSAALVAGGAQELVRRDGDVLLALPR